MSIKGNNTSGLINAVSGDFTILENTTKTRWAVTQIHLHEYGGTGDTIQLFQSADATSATSERVDNIVLAADDTSNSTFTTLILQPSEFLLGNALTGSLVNVEAIYTIYSGDS